MKKGVYLNFLQADTIILERRCPLRQWEKCYQLLYSEDKSVSNKLTTDFVQSRVPDCVTLHSVLSI